MSKVFTEFVQDVWLFEKLNKNQFLFKVFERVIGKTFAKVFPNKLP